MIVTRVYFFLLRRGLFSGRFVRRVLLVDFFYEILFCAVVIARKEDVKCADGIIRPFDRMSD